MAIERKPQAVREYRWQNGKRLRVGERALIMGILNVTPDSFSDGGKYNDVDRALTHALQMVKEGADIIDIGAESSHPGFVPMSAEKEMTRLAPYLQRLAPEIPVPISVDTFKAQTAEMALTMGADMLNDIWGLQYKEEPGQMAKVAAKYQVPIVVMHNQEGTNYFEDIITSIRRFFRESLRLAEVNGLSSQAIILDPGIGFGKTWQDNLVVLRRLDELLEYDGQTYPLLLGASRKSFIGHALNLPVEERMEATGAVSVLGLLSGVAIHRVHDVKPIARMCHMMDAILGTEFKA